MKVHRFGVVLRLKAVCLLAFLTLVVSGLGFSEESVAHQFEAETVLIDHPYAFATPPGVKAGGVFFDAIRAVGEAGDRLVSASSPAAARVEIHRMQMDGDIMRMREVGEVLISKTAPVSFRKGAHDGYHLMLMDLSKPLSSGMSLPITLRFEKAGDIQVEAMVLPFGSQTKPAKMDHSGHSKH